MSLFLEKLLADSISIDERSMRLLRNRLGMELLSNYQQSTREALHCLCISFHAQLLAQPLLIDTIQLAAPRCHESFYATGRC